MSPREKVRNYISDNLIVFDGQVIFADNDNIFERGFVNSLFAMQLLTYIEQEFSIVLESEDMELSNFNSVDNMVRLIDGKLQR